MRTTSVAVAQQLPDHLLLDVTHVTGAGVHFIGAVPASRVVSEVSVIVGQAFDAPITLEVGTLAAPALLVAGADSELGRVDTFKVDCDEDVGGDDLYVTLIIPGAAPTVGAARVIVYTA